LAVSHSRSKQATWVAWFLEHGEWPTAGLQVLHRCDTPACVRPDHLFLGTQRNNMADKLAKGRHRFGFLSGEDNPGAKLTVENVAEIRRRYAAPDHPGQWVLAREFGISRSLIQQIVQGKAWRGAAA